MKITLPILRTITLFLIFAGALVGHAHADESGAQNQAKQVWQMLDYVAVDYGGAVQNGKIVSDAEYKEMQEFADSAERQLAELPDVPSRAALLKDAAALRTAIANKAAAATVAEQARRLAGAVHVAYPFAVSPSNAPDLQLGARLYQSHCASCHGAQGRGDGPLAAGLNPPPIALSDPERARERSVFSLHQIITRGVEGTSMPGFATLSEDERWAVAFFAATLSYSDEDRQAGAKLWSSGLALQASVPTLEALTQTSEAALATRLAPDTARAVLAHLRSRPDALDTARADSLIVAKTNLRDSLKALENGDAAGALRHALAAYLDGFEPAEPALAAKNKPLFEDIEQTMGLYRGAIAKAQLNEARDIEERLQTLLTQAQAALSEANVDPMATFIGALTILLREGVEALLVVVAMVAFLKKADRRDVLPYVHTGWIAALATGGMTWAAATYLVDVSGASRELTEGISAIFAAVVLLSVGIWMHRKSTAGRWQAYVTQKLSSALNKRSAWMLFMVSFVTVYREVFETVLFYAALWTEGNGSYLLAGFSTGVAILAVIAAVLLRTSARLPISQFFAVSAVMVAVLAVVLTGKGVSELQKVGIFGMTPIALPRIDVLGVYPSLQTMVAQLLVLLIVITSFYVNLRSQKKINA